MSTAPMEAFQVKLPVDIREELAEIAKTEDRTTASLIRIACREYLDRRNAAKEGGDDGP